MLGWLFPLNVAELHVLACNLACIQNNIHEGSRRTYNTCVFSFNILELFPLFAVNISQISFFDILFSKSITVVPDMQRYAKVGYTMDIMRQSACLIVKPNHG